MAVGAQALPLQGRTIDGHAVAADDASARFEYDPNLDITWLRDWNVAGAMPYEAARTWASSLAPGGITGWRLPSGLNVDGSGYCTGATCRGEMGHLWYEVLHNPPPGPPSPINAGPFLNFQLYAYWLAEPDLLNPSAPLFPPLFPPPYLAAYQFMTGLSLQGVQTTASVSTSWLAVAVLEGDVLSAVPELPARALLLAGVGAIVLRWRSRTSGRP